MTLCVCFPFSLLTDDGCCTNEEILDASLGTIFVGESTVDYGNSTNRVVSKL